MTEPKALTEKEAAILFGGLPVDHILPTLRERGLIAPEPVDALETQAGELARRYLETDDWQAHDLALAALKRGMELRPALTREMVRDAVGGISYEVFECDSRDTIADRLHAALTQVQP